VIREPDAGEQYCQGENDGEGFVKEALRFEALKFILWQRERSALDQHDDERQDFLDETPRSAQDPLAEIDDGFHDIPPLVDVKRQKAASPKPCVNTILGKGLLIRLL
jgi:hypothetical protein